MQERQEREEEEGEELVEVTSEEGEKIWQEQEQRQTIQQVSHLFHRQSLMNIRALIRSHDRRDKYEHKNYQDKYKKGERIERDHYRR